MKVKAQAYQAPNGSSATRLPPALENLREWALAQITARMRVFAISKLTARPVQCGIRVVNDVSFKPMAETIPQELALLRNSVVRAEAEFMLSFGLTEVELSPTEEDMQQMRVSWATMSKYPVPAAAATADAAKNIPLNVEADPSGQSILDQANTIAAAEAAAEVNANGKE
jgi:hypothetical protein